MDKFHIQDLCFYGYHGALPEENILGQTYQTSLTFELDTREAAEADDLSKTMDYRQAIEIVRKEVTGPPHKLIETVAENIAAGLLAGAPRVVAVTVHLTKPHPPVGIDIGGVTVEIRRERVPS